MLSPPSQQRNSSVRSTIQALAIIVLVTSTLRLPLLNVPFERDEGEYAYIAWRMGHDELPYRDWVDQKPPGIFWVYRLALTLPLKAVPAVHLMGLLWSAGSACALFYLARRFVNPLAAGAAAVLFAILLADPMINGTAANTELFMLLPLVLSQLVFFHANAMSRRSVLLMGLCGVLIGTAAAFKQVAVVNWLFLLAIYPVFAVKKERLTGTLLFGCSSAIGVVAVWTMIAGYFFWRNGFDDFVYHVFTHNLQYVSALPWEDRWKYFQDTIRLLWPTQLAVWVMAGLTFLMRRPVGGGKWLLFIAGWLLTSLAGVSASGYFFPHYFQQLLPALAITAIMGAERVCQVSWLARMPLTLQRLAVALLLAILPALVFYPFLFKFTPAEAVRRIYPGNFFDLMPTLGAKLAQATQPDDKVFIFGAEPELLFYAQRVSATRYIFLFPLYGPYADALEKQKATAEEISRARPAAAFYSPNGLFFTAGSEQYFTRWSQEYLKSNYRPDTYLTMDSSRAVHLLTSDNGLPPLIPSGQRRLAALLLRDF